MIYSKTTCKEFGYAHSGYTDEFREFKSLLVFQSCNTLVEVCGGSLPSFHCIPPSTPSLMQFKTHIKRKKPKYQYLRIYTVS